MSKAFHEVAQRCSKFEHTTRLVLIILCINADDKGVCNTLSLTDLMAAANCPRQPTVSGALTALRRAGAIQKTGDKYHLVIQIDWKWLNAHAYTPQERAKFTYKSKTKGFADYGIDEAAAPPPPPVPKGGKPLLTTIAQHQVMNELMATVGPRDAVEEFLKVFPDAVRVQGKSPAAPTTAEPTTKTVYPGTGEDWFK